ncbi:histone deacetylase [Streptomyces sp. NBC_01317]|uniref:histone deacetylase n=1 Tax=Streptomyces sp. NBC_01317 TaxID=2903822 RepID=UPI002E155215|nr:histone deacetylase [Streptomyces sp. NBC_01317]
MERLRVIEETVIEEIVIEETATTGHASPRQVWYLSYGSNVDLGRLAYYLTGGRPPGAARAYRGCRDPRPPERSVPVEVAGAVYFATESPVWGGGRAFYDPDAPGRVLGRAHLVTAGQFSDIAAQEMYGEPGTDLDLAGVVSGGRVVRGEGRYETLVCPGALDGAPVVTFTAHWGVGDVEPNAPSAAYLAFLGRGLLAAGAWDVETVVAYVAACSGVSGRWTEREIRGLVGG